MSAYCTKVVAVLHTQSACGTTSNTLRENFPSLQAGQVAVSITQPAYPSEGQLWFDKSALKLKIFVDDGNSCQWVQI